MREREFPQYNDKAVEALIKWGPREIDIDILFCDDLIYKDDALEIPHRRLHERDFVLKPLIELDPDFAHPVLKKTAWELYKSLEENSSIARTSEP